MSPTGFSPTVDTGTTPDTTVFVAANTTGVQAVEEVPLRRTSLLFPAPVVGAFGRPTAWAPTTVVSEPLGVLRISVAGLDVTYFRGVPTTIDSWGSQEPFGDDAMQFTMPQIGWIERFGHGSLWWIAAYDVNVDLWNPAGTTRIARLFEGLLMSTEFEADGSAVVFQAVGALFQADLTIHVPELSQKQRDVATLTKQVLDGTPTRRFAPTYAVPTGILTTRRGSWGPRLTGVLSEVLADSYTADGTSQWTVHKNRNRQPVMRLKDKTTHHWSVWFGAPGVNVRLRDDFSARVNTIYGEGTAPSGGHWRNTKYPGWRLDTAPAYPGLLSPGQTGSGVYQQVWDELDSRGYRIYSVGGYYDPRDADEVRDVQRRAGVQVDGVIGAQTWVAIFGVEATDDLDAPYIAPLAVWNKVEPLLYNSDGSVRGANPYYEGTRLVRIERYENFGEGVRKADAVVSAKREIKSTEDYQPNYVGTFDLTVDPEEGSRLLMAAGQNLWVKGVFQPLDQEPGGVLLHMSKVTVTPGGSTTGEVSLLGHDLTTLTAIKRRDREAQVDIARRKSLQRRQSTTQQDRYAVFDQEAGAGKIPRHPLQAGFWSCFRIPAGEVGTIVSTTWHTRDALSRLAVGIFSGPVTANQLAAQLGSTPFASSIWDTNRAWLDAHGFLIGWGGGANNMGFYPSEETVTGAPLTGAFHDDASWSYASQHPPWLWVAEIAENTCFAYARLLAGVD